MAKAPPPPAPAKFVVSNLAISPAEVTLSEEIAISIEVTNTGGRDGSHLLSLWIDEVLEETKKVTLAPKAVKAIVFTVTRDEPGSYSVDVNGLGGSFTVRAAPPPPTPPAPIPPPPPAKPLPLPLVGGIIVGVIVVGLLSFFLIRRRTVSKAD